MPKPLPVLAVIAAGTILLTSCSSEPRTGVDDEGYMWECGKVLTNSGRAAPVIYDVLGGRVSPITSASTQGLIFLKVTPDCKTGVPFEIVPSDAVKVVEEVNDSSGVHMVVGLKPNKTQFRVHIKTPSGQEKNVEVRLDALEPSGP